MSVTPSLCVQALMLIILQTDHSLAETVCDGKVNLVIGMDSSSSLAKFQFYQIKNFTANGLIPRFRHKHYIATVGFAGRVEVVTNFAEFDKNKIMMYMNNEKREYNTRIDYVIGNMTDLSRWSKLVDKTAPNVVLVITDGKSTSTLELLHKSARYADRHNVYVMALGVGDIRNLSPGELANMTHGIKEHQTITNFPQLTKSVDNVVEQICYLSQDGSIRQGIMKGEYLLTIVFDVNQDKFNNVIALINKLLSYIEIGESSVNLVITTTAPKALVGRFDEKSSLQDIRNFLDKTSVASIKSPLYDPEVAYKRVKEDFLFAPVDMLKLALFITDKPIRDFGSANTFFQKERSFNYVKNLKIINVGIGSVGTINADHTLALSDDIVANRIIVSSQSLLSSGLNNIVRALGAEIVASPKGGVNSKHHVYQGPAELVIGYSYCPARHNMTKFNKYNEFLRNIVRNIEISPRSVQFTALTYCSKPRDISSIKDYQRTFHVPYGLQRGGSITQLQWTTSNVIRESINLFDDIQTNIKMAVVIVYDPFGNEDLPGLVNEAQQRGILILPIVVYTNNLNQMQAKANAMKTSLSPMFLTLSDLKTVGAQRTMIILNKFLTGKRNDVLVTAASMSLTNTILKDYFKIYVQQLLNLNQRQSADALQKSILKDIDHKSDQIRLLNGRYTHMGLYGMMLGYRYSEDLTENRIGFLITKDISSKPALTRSVARLLKDMKVSLFAIGYEKNIKRDYEFLDITGNKNNIVSLDWSHDIVTAIASVTGLVERGRLDPTKATHITVVLDTSLNVTAREIENLKVMINAFIQLWSNGKNYFLTAGQYGKNFIPLFVRERLDGSTYKSIMNKVFKLQRVVPTENTLDVNPSSLPVHEMINRLKVRITTTDKTDSRKVLLVIFDKVPRSWPLLDIALREATLDGIDVITVGLDVENYENTLVLTLKSSVVNDVSQSSLMSVREKLETLTSFGSKGNFDLMIALSADSSTTPSVLKWMKLFSEHLTVTYANSGHLTKYGVTTFSESLVDVNEYTDFQKNNLDIFKKNIRDYEKHKSTQPKHDVVIKELLGLVDTSMSTAAKIGLIIVDDDTDNDFDLRSVSKDAHYRGINLMSIGVGGRVDSSEVSRIADNNANRYIQLDSVEELNTKGLEWTLKTFSEIDALHLNVKTTAAPESTTLPPINLKECSGVADIAIAMDASGSMSTELFSAIKRAVANTVMSMQLTPTKIRIRGVITFDEDVREISVDDTNKHLLQAKILSAKHTKGMTNTSKALEKLTEYLTSDPKRAAKKIGVVITDGKSKSPARTKVAAKAAVDKGITMIVMGIGDDKIISYSELLDIANNVKDNVLWLKTMASFLTFGTQTLHGRICKDDSFYLYFRASSKVQSYWASDTLGIYQSTSKGIEPAVIIYNINVATTACLSNEFRCKDGSCIQVRYKCDGVNDCPDSSDEDSGTCDSSRPCPEGLRYRCDDGECVNGAKCNGKVECKDGSDEAVIKCAKPTPTTTTLSTIPTTTTTRKTTTSSTIPPPPTTRKTTSSSTTTQPITTSTTTISTTTVTTTMPTIRNPTDPEEICAKCKCTGIVHLTDPKDCSKYHICVDAKWIQTAMCPPEQFWNEEKVTCMPTIEANCKYDPCKTREHGFNYTTDRLIYEKRCDQFYTCHGGYTKKLCTCGERIGTSGLIHRKYDANLRHCVDDEAEQCFTFLHKDRLIKEKIVTTYECFKRPVSRSKSVYYNMKTNTEETCPSDDEYNHDVCRCTGKKDQSSPNTGVCKPDVDINFDTPKMQTWNVTLTSDGFGLFNGRTTMVTINHLKNTYNEEFVVKLSFKTSTYKNMLLFENFNCQNTNLPTLSVYLEYAEGMMYLNAALYTSSGFINLRSPSPALTSGMQITMTLASHKGTVAMWTKVNNEREGDHTLTVLGELKLSCQSPLTLGKGVTGNKNPFEGSIDYFRWYHSCRPYDVEEFFKFIS